MLLRMRRTTSMLFVGRNPPTTTWLKSVPLIVLTPRWVSRASVPVIPYAWQDLQRQANLLSQVRTFIINFIVQFYTRLKEAHCYWQHHAPFNGIPFRADLGTVDTKRILDMFSMKGMNCRSAVTVPICINFLFLFLYWFISLRSSCSTTVEVREYAQIWKLSYSPFAQRPFPIRWTKQLTPHMRRYVSSYTEGRMLRLVDIKKG